MENYYTAYTKVINGVTFYFVKKFKTFPEYKDVEPILESYGMHTDFDKACEIAGIQENDVKKQLLDELQRSAHQAKVIDLTQDISFTNQKTINL